MTNDQHAEAENGKLLFKCLIKVLNVSFFRKKADLRIIIMYFLFRLFFIKA